MNPYAAFGIGVLVGVGLSAYAVASLAPNAAYQATILAGREVAGVPGLPGAISDGITRPLALMVRTIVARKVAPWTL